MRVNRAAEELAGKPRDELLGRTLFELYPAMDDAVRANLCGILRERRGVRYETFYAPTARLFETRAEPSRGGGVLLFFRDVTELRAAQREAEAERSRLRQLWLNGDGTLLERYFDLVCQAHRDEAGGVTAIVATGYDVTSRVRERQRIEAAAASTELDRRRLQAVFESLDEGIFVTDFAGRVLWNNRAALRLYGLSTRALPLSVSDCMSRLHLEELDGSALPTDRRPFARVLRGESFAGYELRARRRDSGETFVGSFSGRPVTSTDGNVLVGVVTVRDVTEAHDAVQALRSSERRYRTLVSATVTVVWTTDAEGRFVVPQDSWELFTGQPWAEHSGFGWADAIHPDDRASVLEQWKLATGNPPSLYQSEGRLWHAPTGEYRYFTARAAPLIEDDGSVREWIGTVTDVTEEKRAREASRQKSEFLANMSHELRTPLNAVIGFSEMLHAGRLGPLTARQVEFVGHIAASSRHLLALIDDVLDLSKIEAGRLQLRPERVDVRATVEHVVDILREMSARKGIAIEVDVSSEVGEVFLDPARLKQVLYNYLSNALKFTPDGGHVTVRGRTEGSASFRIEVQDTGIGIRKEDVGRLFQAFQQLDSSSSKRYPGTGLGLSLTRQIVTSQGGRVGVVSTPGEGSTFFAVLPRAQETRAPAEPAGGEPRGPGAEAGR